MNPFLRFAVHATLHTAGAALAFYALAAALAETLTQPLITTPENTQPCPECGETIDAFDWPDDLPWLQAIHQHWVHGPGQTNPHIRNILRKHGYEFD